VELGVRAFFFGVSGRFVGVSSLFWALETDLDGGVQLKFLLSVHCRPALFGLAGLRGGRAWLGASRPGPGLGAAPSRPGPGLGSLVGGVARGVSLLGVVGVTEPAEMHADIDVETGADTAAETAAA